MSNTLNTFSINLATETSLTSYTATFSDVDNIEPIVQTLRYGTIGNFKILFGTIEITFLQDNQALGSHTISLPDDFFDTIFSASLKMTRSDAYQMSAHGGDVALDSIQVYYDQGIAPGGIGTTATLNLLIIGF
jgi:hypothetical protein